MVTIMRVLMAICLLLTAEALRASISRGGIRSAASRLQFGPGVSPGSDEFLKSMLKPDGDDIWTTRRRIVRSFLTASIKAEQKREEERQEKGEDKELTKEEINAKRRRLRLL